MKPTAEYSRWINLFPANPVQTGLLRFTKLPGSDMRTRFSDAADDFNKTMLGKDRLKTSYSEMWQD